MPHFSAPQGFAAKAAVNLAAIHRKLNLGYRDDGEEAVVGLSEGGGDSEGRAPAHPDLLRSRGLKKFRTRGSASLR
jgi:hypothetical protein